MMTPLQSFRQNTWVKLDIDIASSGWIGVGAAIGDHNDQFAAALMCYMDRILILSHRASRTLHDQTGSGVRRWVQVSKCGGLGYAAKWSGCTSQRSRDTIWGTSMELRRWSKLQSHLQGPDRVYKWDLLALIPSTGRRSILRQHHGSTWREVRLGLQQLQVPGTSVDCILECIIHRVIAWSACSYLQLSPETLFTSILYLLHLYFFVTEEWVCMLLCKFVTTARCYPQWDKSTRSCRPNHLVHSGKSCQSSAHT